VRIYALNGAYYVGFISFKEIHTSTSTSGRTHAPEQMYIPHSPTFHASIAAIEDEPQRDLL
jgi:hypothetical protein